MGALLVGLQPEMCRDEAVSLVGVDAESGATWPFPPTLFLSVVLDHPIILRYMKNCVEYFLERVRHPHPRPTLLPLSTDPFLSSCSSEVQALDGLLGSALQPALASACV